MASSTCRVHGPWLLARSSRASRRCELGRALSSSGTASRSATRGSGPDQPQLDAVDLACRCAGQGSPAARRADVEARPRRLPHRSPPRAAPASTASKPITPIGRPLPAAGLDPSAAPSGGRRGRCGRRRWPSSVLRREPHQAHGRLPGRNADQHLRGQQPPRGREPEPISRSPPAAASRTASRRAAANRASRIGCRTRPAKAARLRPSTRRRPSAIASNARGGLVEPLAAGLRHARRPRPRQVAVQVAARSSASRPARRTSAHRRPGPCTAGDPSRRALCRDSRPGRAHDESS